MKHIVSALLITGIAMAPCYSMRPYRAPSTTSVSRSTSTTQPLSSASQQSLFRMPGESIKRGSPLSPSNTTRRDYTVGTNPIFNKQHDRQGSSSTNTNEFNRQLVESPNNPGAKWHTVTKLNNAQLQHSSFTLHSVWLFILWLLGYNKDKATAAAESTTDLKPTPSAQQDNQVAHQQKEQEEANRAYAESQYPYQAYYEDHFEPSISMPGRDILNLLFKLRNLYNDPAKLDTPESLSFDGGTGLVNTLTEVLKKEYTIEHKRAQQSFADFMFQQVTQTEKALNPKFIEDRIIQPLEHLVAKKEEDLQKRTSYTVWGITLPFIAKGNNDPAEEAKIAQQKQYIQELKDTYKKIQSPAKANFYLSYLSSLYEQAKQAGNDPQKQAAILHKLAGLKVTINDPEAKEQLALYYLNRYSDKQSFTPQLSLLKKPSTTNFNTQAFLNDMKGIINNTLQKANTIQQASLIDEQQKILANAIQSTTAQLEPLQKQLSLLQRSGITAVPEEYQELQRRINNLEGQKRMLKSILDNRFKLLSQTQDISSKLEEQNKILERMASTQSSIPDTALPAKLEEIRMTKDK